MSTSKVEQIKDALSLLACRDHSHLLFEQRLSEWETNVLASARARAALEVLSEKPKVGSSQPQKRVPSNNKGNQFAESFFVD